MDPGRLPLMKSSWPILAIRPTEREQLEDLQLAARINANRVHRRASGRASLCVASRLSGSRLRRRRRRRWLEPDPRPCRQGTDRLAQRPAAPRSVTTASALGSIITAAARSPSVSDASASRVADVRDQVRSILGAPPGGDNPPGSQGRGVPSRPGCPRPAAVAASASVSSAARPVWRARVRAHDGMPGFAEIGPETDRVALDRRDRDERVRHPRGRPQHGRPSRSSRIRCQYQVSLLARSAQCALERLEASAGRPFQIASSASAGIVGSRELGLGPRRSARRGVPGVREPRPTRSDGRLRPNATDRIDLPTGPTARSPGSSAARRDATCRR